MRFTELQTRQEVPPSSGLTASQHVQTKPEIINGQIFSRSQYTINKEITIACHPDEGGNYVLELNFDIQ